MSRSADVLEFVDDLSKDISSFLDRRGYTSTGIQGIIDRLGGQVIYNRPSQSDREKWADALGVGRKISNTGKSFPPKAPMTIFGAPSHSSTFQWPSEKEMHVSLSKDCGDNYVPTTDLLKFSSCFESGNLKCASYQGIVNDLPTYDLVLDHDVNTNGHTQWYYFAVRSTNCERVRFRVVNFCKAQSLYRRGMQPKVWSERHAYMYLRHQIDCNNASPSDDMLSALWRSEGENVSYHRNNLLRPKPGYGNGWDDVALSDFHENEHYVKIRKKRGRSLYSFTFEYTFEHYDDCVFFAYHFPYTYTMCRTFINTIQDHQAKSCWFRRKRLCHTLGGVECDFVGITNWAIPRKQKKVIVVVARVHPGESNASWMCHGLVNFLLSNNPEAHVLRDHFLWKIVPILNPDGVICGNYRCGLAGVDLNRQWRHPEPLLHRTVYEAKKQIHKLKNDLCMFIDLHGHSRKFNCFAYSQSSYQQKDSRCYMVRMYPKLISMVSPDFAYHSCRWTSGPGKRGTGRVVVNKDIGLDASYTIEASFFGAHPDPNLSDCGTEESEGGDESVPGSPKRKKKELQPVIMFTPTRMQQLGCDLTRALVLHHNLGYEVAMMIRARDREIQQQTDRSSAQPPLTTNLKDAANSESSASLFEKHGCSDETHLGPLEDGGVPSDPAAKKRDEGEDAQGPGSENENAHKAEGTTAAGEDSDSDSDSLSGLSALTSRASESPSSNSRCSSRSSSPVSDGQAAEREQDTVESSCVFPPTEIQWINRGPTSPTLPSSLRPPFAKDPNVDISTTASTQPSVPASVTDPFGLDSTTSSNRPENGSRESTLHSQVGGPSGSSLVDGQHVQGVPPSTAPTTNPAAEIDHTGGGARSGDAQHSGVGGPNGGVRENGMQATNTGPFAVGSETLAAGDTGTEAKKLPQVELRQEYSDKTYDTGTRRKKSREANASDDAKKKKQAKLARRREKAAKREEEKREKRRLRKELAKKKEKAKLAAGKTKDSPTRKQLSPKKPNWAGQAPVSSLFDSWGDDVITIVPDWPKLDDLTEEERENLKLEFRDPKLSYLNIDLKQIEATLAEQPEMASDIESNSGSDSNPSEDNLNAKELEELGHRLGKKRRRLRRICKRRQRERSRQLSTSRLLATTRSLSMTNLGRGRACDDVTSPKRQNREKLFGASDSESDPQGAHKRSVAFGRTTYVDMEKLNAKSKQLPLLSSSPNKLQRSCSLVLDERRQSPLRRIETRWSMLPHTSRWSNDGCGTDSGASVSGTSSPLHRRRDRVDVDTQSRFQHWPYTTVVPRSENALSSPPPRFLQQQLAVVGSISSHNYVQGAHNSPSRVCAIPLTYQQQQAEQVQSDKNARAATHCGANWNIPTSPTKGKNAGLSKSAVELKQRTDIFGQRMSFVQEPCGDNLRSPAGYNDTAARDAIAAKLEPRGDAPWFYKGGPTNSNSHRTQKSSLEERTKPLRSDLRQPSASPEWHPMNCENRSKTVARGYSPCSPSKHATDGSPSFHHEDATVHHTAPPRDHPRYSTGQYSPVALRWDCRAAADRTAHDEEACALAEGHAVGDEQSSPHSRTHRMLNAPERAPTA